MTVIELRRAKGMAQEALALESGVDRGYMGGLERGRHLPTLDTIYRLLPVFSISFAQFAERFENNLRKAQREMKRNNNE